MKRLNVLACVLTGLLGASLAHADGARLRDPGVNARQHNQRDRIQQGVRSGELTRRETGRLAAEQRDVRQLEAHPELVTRFARVLCVGVGWAVVARGPYAGQLAPVLDFERLVRENVDMLIEGEARKLSRGQEES